MAKNYRVAVIAGFMSVLMRAQLAHPHNTLITDHQAYNVLITAHGLLMVFFAVMPATMASAVRARIACDFSGIRSASTRPTE